MLFPFTTFVFDSPSTEHNELYVPKSTQLNEIGSSITFLLFSINDFSIGVDFNVV
jgi:hypothetical protein